MLPQCLISNVLELSSEHDYSLIICNLLLFKQTTFLGIEFVLKYAAKCSKSDLKNNDFIISAPCSPAPAPPPPHTHTHTHTHVCTHARTHTHTHTHTNNFNDGFCMVNEDNPWYKSWIFGKVVDLIQPFWPQVSLSWHLMLSLTVLETIQTFKIFQENSDFPFFQILYRKFPIQKYICT